MLLRIINSALILFVAFMGTKQGWAMVSAKPQMLEMLGKWGFTKTGVAVFGIATMLGTLLILFPKTFVWGNMVMAATILCIMCFQLNEGNLRGAAIEVPFLLLNLLIIYLQHPLHKN